MKSKELFVALCAGDADHLVDFILSQGGMIQWVTPLEAWPDKARITWVFLEKLPQSVSFRFDNGKRKMDAGLIDLSLDPCDDLLMDCARLYCSSLDAREPAVAKAWEGISKFVKSNYKKHRIDCGVTTKGPVVRTVYLAPQAEQWLAIPGHRIR